MNNAYLIVYDVIRVYKQKTILLEINTWVKKKDHVGFPDYKCLNSFSIFETQL